MDAAARRVLKRRRSGPVLHPQHRARAGLEVHEMPRLGKGEKTMLQEGMVMTVEPGVYIEGLGGIRIEDDVVVTSQGRDGPDHRAQGISRTLNGEKNETRNTAGSGPRGVDLAEVERLLALHAKAWPRGVRIRARRRPRPAEEAVGASAAAFARAVQRRQCTPQRAGASARRTRRQRLMRLRPRTRRRRAAACRGSARHQIADRRHLLLCPRVRTPTRLSPWARKWRPARCFASSKP